MFYKSNMEMREGRVNISVNLGEREPTDSKTVLWLLKATRSGSETCRDKYRIRVFPHHAK